MRANPADYELVAPGNLPAVLSLLAKEPGAWLPIAGGTDVMVVYATGKLPARRLVSIWNLPELRKIEVLPTEIQIGGACTYTDIQKHEVIRREFSMLSLTGSWTGGIANQNRGTIGGNIANASPAGDSLPPLLAYEADLLLVSSRGERRVPYNGFHLGYRKTQLAPDELIRAVCLPRRFSNYGSYVRKVGTRNAQAIAKLSLAGLALIREGIIEDVRLAMGSVDPVPIRLAQTEEVLKGKRIDPKSVDAQLVRLACRTASAEIRPIDDIRSTARYRAAVTGNLVAEFLERLPARGQ